MQYCKWFFRGIFAAALDTADDRRPTLRLPDQSHAGSGRRQMEPADHPRHDVRQPAAFSRIADQIRRRHFLQHPRRPAEDAARAGHHHPRGRPQPQAEGNLFADRTGHRAAADPGPDVGLGIQISPRHRRTRHPRQATERRRPEDVGGVHGRIARDSSRREAAAQGGPERRRAVAGGVSSEWWRRRGRSDERAVGQQLTGFRPSPCYTDGGHACALPTLRSTPPTAASFPSRPPSSLRTPATPAPRGCAASRCRNCGSRARGSPARSATGRPST